MGIKTEEIYIAHNQTCLMSSLVDFLARLPPFLLGADSLGGRAFTDAAEDFLPTAE
jgi:hypothetical protein